MSELIENARRRRDLLKHMIRQLHDGQAPQQVRAQLRRLLGEVPYDDVVAVEQELIAEGLPTEEILRLCDVHSEALQGSIVQLGGRLKGGPPKGHPAHTLKEENTALSWELKQIDDALAELAGLPDDADATGQATRIRARVNALLDVDKHYLRKEYLIFPFLEKRGVTGPPKVMWGKHDQTRELLRAAAEALHAATRVTAGELRGVVDLVLKPATEQVAGMIDKEEQIFIPLCLDTLDERDWWEVAKQSPEYGWCLYDPPDSWRPASVPAEEAAPKHADDRIRLPSGSFTAAQLQAVLNTIPFDLTFVDADDTVRYFTQGTERIFSRSRAILGRKVQFCHPPSSVHTVERILDGFRSGQKDRAAFWINLRGRFVSIEYFALRGDKGEYLGCLEVSQDLTAKRALQGEQRLLDWEAGNA